MTDEKLPVIYVYPAVASPFGDCVYYAITEDGEELARHVSSSVEWGKRDMGIGTTSKHEIYVKKYPDAFILEWVQDWRSHPILSKVMFDKEQVGVPHGTTDECRPAGTSECWCETHERSIWGCAKVFQRRAQLLEEQVTLLRKLKVVENELKLLMTSGPN